MQFASDKRLTYAADLVTGMNWAVFALTLGLIYLVVFFFIMKRRGWSLAALLVGLLHIVFAAGNSAAPVRSLFDDMYMGWQIGLLRFEGHAAVLPTTAVLLWSLMCAWLCADRSKKSWMRLIVWGDAFWLTNICGAMLLAITAGQFGKAKIQAGEYFEISGLAVAFLLLLGTISMFGLSVLWAYRQTKKDTSGLAASR
jgi:hypothetical protein